MRKLSFLLLAGALFLGISCTPDLKDVYDRLGALEERMAELTTTTETANSAFTIANALKDKVYVDSVTETEDGYVIKFSNGTTATIKDGEPGQDATAPTIGIKEVDGELVWTVNDQVVKDASGKPVPATVKVPEFKFDNNKWWYRFGAEDTWKDCGEKTGPEPSITEDEEYVYITIGGNQVAIPKAVIAPSIESITAKLKPSKLFIPVGKSADLKDFFEVGPEGALKTSVNYDYAAGAFEIDDKGIITVTGNSTDANPSDNFVVVTVSAKNDPDIKTTFYVRSCPTPANEEPESTCTVPEADRLYLFNNTPESFSSFVSIGGQGSWNPINNSVSGLMGPGGKANIYFKAPEVKNPSFTLANGHLHFKYYVSTVEKLNLADALVELTSTVLDNNELSWTGKLGDVKVGWNEIDLAFKDGVDSGIPDFGPFDPTVLSFFRLNISTSANNDEAVQVKDLFVYAEEGPVQITIDGDMSDWAKVKGATNDAAEARYAEFKMASDETNLYFYTRRTTFQYTDIWNGKGYVYYAFDLDNDASTGGSTLWENGPYEFIFVIWPFAGTSDAPAFAATPLGDSTILPSGDIKTHYNANGTFDPAKGAELEFSIPRADLPAIPASKITVYSWGNKGGENMKSHPISVTL